MISNSEAFEIISKGFFYYPAYKHYGNNPKYIKCNLCNFPNITSSIGFQNYDICLSCVDSILNKIPLPQIQPSLYQNSNSIYNSQSINKTEPFSNELSSLDEYFMPLNSFSNMPKR